MRKLSPLFLCLCIFTQTVLYSPNVFANFITNDQEIMMCYRLALNSTDPIKKINQTTEMLISRGISKKKITSVLKRHLLKNNSANYFELTEKIKFIQDDLNLTEQQQMLEINELIFTLSQEVQVTGLSFSASYKSEALMITLIFMLVVTSLVASTSNT